MAKLFAHQSHTIIIWCSIKFISILKTYHKYGVFEVGMSKAGEINNLSKIIRPHIGIITNIGEAHIENFKNVKGIADAKGENNQQYKKKRNNNSKS